jgi:hypothetical protein
MQKHVFFILEFRCHIMRALTIWNLHNSFEKKNLNFIVKTCIIHYANNFLKSAEAMTIEK